MRDQPQSRSLPRPRAGLAVLALAAAFAVVGGVALSDAAAPKPTTLGIAKAVTVAGKSDSIITTSSGLTVYALSGDSARHPKCTKANTCFMFWPPVRVASQHTKLTAASGIHGKLAVIHRNGIFQVTLAGRPLYTFLGDGHHRRSAAGQGIVSFGGKWSVLTVHTAASHTTTSTTSTSTTSMSTTSTSTTSANPYGY
jgi:predicted lipoprotein with Yx(FWY)xxD motif